MRLTLTFCLAALSADLWAADPFPGVWKLNAAQSKFDPGPAPKSLTTTWTEAAGGTKIASSGVHQDGRAIQAEYIAVYDGKERTKPGPWNFNSVVNRQIAENHREDIFKKDGVVAGTVKLVVSEDGKVLTMTWNYGELRDIRVFDRE